MQLQIDELADKLQELKAAVDRLQQSQLNRQTSLAEFEAIYGAHVGPLEERRKELQKRLEDCRIAIGMEAIKRAGDFGETFDEAVFEDDEAYDSYDRDFFFEADDSASTASEYTAVEIDQNRDSMRSIHRFLAKHWHPDLITENRDSHRLMSELNVALDQSEDQVEMLIRLPWDESWRKQASDESLGDQWMRLNSWNVWMSEALERLKEQSASLEHTWNFAYFDNWDKSGRPRAFFSDIATQIRQENEDLQAEIDECQEELDELSEIHDGDG